VSGAEAAPERLTRLLALIAFLRTHPGVPVGEVAAHFAVTPAQVLADVNLLWVSGTPGYLPDDLIDFSYDAFERGELTLTDSRGMHRPLRLAGAEAVALLAALRSLQAVPGLPEAATVASALAKLSAAAGEAAAAAGAIDVRLARPGRGDLLDRLRTAVRERRVVHLRYVSAADVVSERDVDPLQLLSDGAAWFLRAWCHRAGDVRHFRLDRVLAARAEDRRAGEHPELETVADEQGLAPDLSAAELVATLELAPRARWLAESLPVESTATLEDGWARVILRVASRAWIQGVLLALGPDVRAVAPPELAADVARAAADALRAYERLA
jgi:proteasome accessory factor C